MQDRTDLGTPVLAEVLTPQATLPRGFAEFLQLACTAFENLPHGIARQPTKKVTLPLQTQRIRARARAFERDPPMQPGRVEEPQLLPHQPFAFCLQLL